MKLEARHFVDGLTNLQELDRFVTITYEKDEPFFDIEAVVGIEATNEDFDFTIHRFACLSRRSALPRRNAMKTGAKTDRPEAFGEGESHITVTPKKGFLIFTTIKHDKARFPRILARFGNTINFDKSG